MITIHVHVRVHCTSCLMHLSLHTHTHTSVHVHVVFDESGNFLIFASMVGVKGISLHLLLNLQYVQLYVCTYIFVRVYVHVIRYILHIYCTCVWIILDCCLLFLFSHQPRYQQVYQNDWKGELTLHKLVSRSQ